MTAIVYIDRELGGWDGESWTTGPDWTATTGATAEDNEDARFDSVEEAIAWGRERASIVLVRLTGSEADCYSAGEVEAHELMDGSGRAYPLWPPSGWSA